MQGNGEAYLDLDLHPPPRDTALILPRLIISMTIQQYL